MGKKIFDGSSRGHFYGGMTSAILFFPNNIILNFLTSHGLHVLIELIEKNKTLCGQVIESRNNHLGDMMAFFGGWLLAITYNFNSLSNIYIRLVLWGVFIYYNLKEILKEIFPFAKTSWLTGVYRYREKQCYLHKTIK